MKNLVWALILLAAVGFAVATISAVTHYTFFGVAPEGYSRACTNLALLAIGLALVSGEKNENSGP